MHDDLIAAIDRDMPETRALLDDLVRIPSVSAPGFDPEEVRRSAAATARALEEAGGGPAHLLESEGSHPAVFAEIPGPPSAPTVLLYAHHDVQPPGDPADWETDPFEPVERDGRVYGRGTSDDKCGIAIHVAALRAHGGRPPVNVKVLVEGEEEIGSVHLADFLREHGERLAADAIVIADSGNWRTGRPTLTTSLRGLVDGVVEVRTLEHGVHSGMFGGVFPDALMVLARLLATLHDDRGNVAVDGLMASEADPLDLTEEDVRSQAGAIDGVEAIGTGSLTSRMWTRPSVSVLGVDAPRTADAINQLVPVARAKVSVRIAPGDHPGRAFAALEQHLRARTPWGARVTVTRGAAADAFALDAAGPAYEAFRTAFEATWGSLVVEMGVGGSIPFVAAFADAYPQASILLTGVADPASRAHGPNESLDLAEFRNGAVAEAIALRLLAEGS